MSQKQTRSALFLFLPLGSHVAQGNVEYKLQLLSPTPTRFARLVTQLKWRLLEGGGQAYYELGVADCGMLVGLPRHQLEESLETLEMMAGEIGASVTVVKEVEVSPELSSLAQSQIRKWDGKRSTRRKDLLRMVDGSPTMSPTELETQLSTTEVADTSSPSPPALLGVAAVDSLAADTPDTAAIVSQEPRLIVEALVVRKLSLDEVFLDFEGFSLQ